MNVSYIRVIDGAAQVSCILIDLLPAYLTEKWHLQMAS